MAATPSTMIPLGTPMPSFSLPDTVSGGMVTAADVRGGRGVVVAFICNHCPFVKHLREGLAEFGRWCDEKGVKMVAISSNNIETHPDDSPEKMKAEAKQAGYTFPYLYDESQEVAKSFSAACTPDFFLFDGKGKLYYRGQFDESRPNNGMPVTGADLRAAVEALVAGTAAPEDQKPSIGCNIKWKSGNEPEYAR
ncbi:MAG: thioredoxin family protein [Phycisphaeraceae bacterium]|nr:MAG: thioredoxin family protein [Phycisphaeraceae bacterium]